MQIKKPQKTARTHFKTAIDDPNERTGDIEAALDLSDGALQIGSAEGFGEVNKCQGDQKKLQKHIIKCNKMQDEMGLRKKTLFQNPVFTKKGASMQNFCIFIFIAC